MRIKDYTNSEKLNKNDKLQMEEDLILLLFDRNAIKIGDFTLSSGRKSHFYR